MKVINFHLEKEGNGLNLKEEIAYLDHISKSECSKIFLGYVNGQIVSLFNLCQIEKERFNHIAELSCSVRKAYWSQGIASDLLKHVIDYAKKTESLRVLKLEVLTHNLSALSLYKKFNFVVYGTFKKRMHLNGCDYDSYFMNLYL